MSKSKYAHSASRSYIEKYSHLIGSIAPEQLPTYTSPQELGFVKVTLSSQQTEDILDRVIVRKKQRFHQQGALFALLSNCAVGIKTHELEDWGVTSNNYHSYTLAINEKLADSGMPYRIRCMPPKSRVNGRNVSHMMWFVRKANADELSAWTVPKSVIMDRDIWWDSFLSHRFEAA